MVSSINTNQQSQYERKFSLGRTVAGATTGAIALKTVNDVVMRKQASQTLQLLQGAKADEFIKANNISKTAVKQSVNNAKQVLKSTDYLSTIKENVKSPKEAISKLVNYAKDKVTKTNVKDIPSTLKTVPSKAKGLFGKVATKVTKTAKSLKGATLKETFANVMKASKTVKGKQAVNLALGAVCGLLIFGTSKLVKTDKKEA